jgi:hypothetical protein
MFLTKNKLEFYMVLFPVRYSVKSLNYENSSH